MNQPESDTLHILSQLRPVPCPRCLLPNTKVWEPVHWHTAEVKEMGSEWHLQYAGTCQRCGQEYRYRENPLWAMRRGDYQWKTATVPLDIIQEAEEVEVGEVAPVEEKNANGTPQRHRGRRRTRRHPTRILDEARTA